MSNLRKSLMAATCRMIVIAALVVVAPAAAMGWEGSSPTQNTIFVDADAAGANDGSSWEDAYTTLQPALDAAIADDEIWVAAGIYKPTYEFIPGDPQSATFQMKKGVTLYGGFDPLVGDTGFEDRDWVTNLTILSGDLGLPDVMTDNSYHVFYHPVALALDETAVLDGFVIIGGYAHAPEHQRGGGMYNYGSSPTLIHCTFTGNSASIGGGLGNEQSSPSVTDCTFSDNSADNGGGIANFYASPVVTGCTFSENLATQDFGGGMFNDFSSPSITNCLFVGNDARDGGGMYNTESSATVINSTFTGNSADRGAGIMSYTNCFTVVTNCTFSGNSATQYAGAIFNGGYGVMSTLTATNNIMWGDSPGELAHTQGSTMVVTYSDVQGTSLYPGQHNINVDPQFKDPAIGDFHLLPESPCIDAGNNDAPSLPAFDFEGDSRITDGNGDGTTTADMGIDESIGYYSLTLNFAGNGSGTVVQFPLGTHLLDGTVVTLTATANQGSSFSGWSGDVIGETNPITLTMDVDKVVTATFVTYRIYMPLLMR